MINTIELSQVHEYSVDSVNNINNYKYFPLFSRLHVILAITENLRDGSGFPFPGKTVKKK